MLSQRDTMAGARSCPELYPPGGSSWLGFGSWMVSSRGLAYQHTHTHTCHDLKMIQIIQAVPTQHKHFCIHYTKKTWQQWPVESSNKSQVFSSYGPRVFVPRDPWSCRSYFYLVWRIVGESGTFVQPTPRWLVSGQKSIGCLCSTKMQTPTVPQFSASTLGRQPSPTSGCRIVFFYLLMEPPGK